MVVEGMGRTITQMTIGGSFKGGAPAQRAWSWPSSRWNRSSGGGSTSGLWAHGRVDRPGGGDPQDRSWRWHILKRILRALEACEGHGPDGLGALDPPGAVRLHEATGMGGMGGEGGGSAGGAAELRRALERDSGVGGVALDSLMCGTGGMGAGDVAGSMRGVRGPRTLRSESL